MQPKYALPEIERRWLADFDAAGALEGDACVIDDIYISGTHLRLRRMAGPDGTVTLKLCKKYGKTSQVSEPITNVYLSRDEYAVLAQLRGRAVRKRRWRVAGGALDVYASADGSAGGVTIFEKEFGSEDEARAYSPPAFARQEITNAPSFSGAALAGERSGGGPVAAVLVHVPQVELALDWYQRAFPMARREFLAEYDMALLRVADVRIEIVPADGKVAAGAAGSVVYWWAPALGHALERLQGLGATLYRGPMRIEAGLAMCMVRDPWGNCIGLRGPDDSGA